MSKTLIHSKKKKPQKNQNEIMPFTVTWMDPETVILSEVKDKDKYHVLTIICGIFKKKKKKKRYKQIFL